MTEPGDERDRSLAAERTNLAWQRSGVSLAACGVAIAKGAPLLSRGGSHQVLGVVVLALGVSTWLLALPRARHRGRVARTGQRPTPTVSDLAPIAYGTAAVGLVAFVIAALRVG